MVQIKPYQVVFERPAADQTWFLVTGVKLTIAYSQEVLQEKAAEYKQYNITVQDFLNGKKNTFKYVILRNRDEFFEFD